MSRQSLLAFLVPFAAIFSAGVVLFFVSQPTGIPRGEPVVTAVNDVHLEEPFVRIEGMAHYGALVRQRVPPRFPWQEEERFFLFPIFAEHAARDRAIRVLVRTKREPERFVHYEYMAVEGRLVRPTDETLPYSTEVEMGKKTDYFFTDELLILEPWRIEAEDEVWEIEQR